MKLVYSIKENLKRVIWREKIQLLTLVPDEWSVHRTMEFFNVLEYSVKQARKLNMVKEVWLPQKTTLEKG